MIESKEGHYIHLFPNMIFFFYVSTFFVDGYKHNILVLCFGQPNPMQFKHRQSSRWLSWFTQFVMFEPEYAPLLSPALI